MWKKFSYLLEISTWGLSFCHLATVRASDSIILFDIVRVINHLYVCMYVRALKTVLVLEGCPGP